MGGVPLTSDPVESLHSRRCTRWLHDRGRLPAREHRGGDDVLTTTDADGESHERVLSPIDYDGRLFVAANHWPRAWYHRALENPEVHVTRKGETTDYRAVPVSKEERKRLLDESGFPLVPYVFTGFAPSLQICPRSVLQQSARGFPCPTRSQSV